MSLFLGNAYSAENKSPLEMIKSKNFRERINGFYSLVDTGGPLTAANCKFKVSDSTSAKKAVINLLRRENKFEDDNYVNGKYAAEIRSELYSEYSTDLGLFVDSCEDESAIDLFPGDRTFKRYPQQSTEAILSTLDNMEKTGFNKNKNAYIVRYLRDSSTRYKKNNRKLYDRVKTKLIELVDDEGLSRTAAGTLEALGDEDLIPVFEKISKYDDSKGTVRISHGRRHVFPVSEIAKRALEKLQGKIKAKSPQLQPGTTQGINVQ
jgi:hypothetical protein